LMMLSEAQAEPVTVAMTATPLLFGRWRLARDCNAC
jgi:hypothetical protein